MRTSLILTAAVVAALYAIACSSNGGEETSIASSESTEDASAEAASGDVDAGRPASDAAVADARGDVDVDATPDTGTVVAYTQAEVQAIFDTRCAGCHIGGTSAGLSLVNFPAQTVGVASTEQPAMKRIEAGSKEDSYLFHKLAGTHLTVGGSGGRMPKSGPPFLSDLEIARIGGYIDEL